MALFKAKETQQQQPQGVSAIDLQAFEQRIMNQVGQAINAGLGPVMTALQVLNQTRQIQQPDDADNNDPPQRSTGLTAEQVQQMIREAQGANQTNNQFIPRGRSTAMKTFRKELESDGLALFDAYSDEVEQIIDSLPPEQQANPQAWEKAFKYVMTDHIDEYAKAAVKEFKHEDLPPHLQTPGGVGGTQMENEPELTEDEKELQPIFDRTYKGGFTKQQMVDFRDLNNGGRFTMDQMINTAREKGLIKDGTKKADQGNNA